MSFISLKEKRLMEKFCRSICKTCISENNAHITALWISQTRATGRYEIPKKIVYQKALELEFIERGTLAD